MSALDGYYRDGLRIETEFEGNAFAIDPEGCGCTDCITGQAFHPSDEWNLKKVLAQGRELINRTGHEVILPNGFRLDNGGEYPPRARFHACPDCRCTGGW